MLVLAPHTDDAELGAGGTIARLTDEGAEVHVAAFSTCEASLPPEMAPDTLKLEMMEALPLLGVDESRVRIFNFPVRYLHQHRQEVLEALLKMRAEIRPEMVFVPSRQDMHQDHQVVHQEGLRAFKNVTLFGYELPWNNIRFDCQAFFRIQPSHLERKIAALDKYLSQKRKARDYFGREFLTSWARFRGLQVGAEYAEVFEVIRVTY